MATAGNNLIIVNLKTQSGEDNYVLIDKAIADWIQSEDCDPASRKAIMDAVCDKNNNASDVHVNGAESSSSADVNSGPSPNTKQCQGSAEIHTWSESEEKLLINVRGNLESQFIKSRNHDSLWEQIVSEMNKNVAVTKLQVINKWKNMKKKYKEVKDNSCKTGSEPLNWKHMDSFDEIFGHKESTRPAVIIDFGKIKLFR